MKKHLSAQHDAVVAGYRQLLIALTEKSHTGDQKALAHVQDEFDRYIVWAKNVGAPFRGSDYKRSLDYRLREAASHKEAVSKILLRTESLLEQLSTSLQDTDEPSAVIDPSAPTSAGEEAVTADDDKESSWSLSSDESLDLQLPSLETHQGKLSAVSFQLTADRSSTPANLTRDFSFRLEILLRSLKLSLSSLYKIPIRRFPTSEKVQHLARRYDIDLNYFQPFDVAWVRELFRDAGEPLTFRLGRMITRRRQILEMQSLRNQELKREAFDSAQRQNSIQQLPSRAVSAPGLPAPREDPMMEQGSAPSVIATSLKATTFRAAGASNLSGPSFLEPAPSESAESVSSVATTRAAQDELSVPPRPLNKDGSEMEDFECPFCCTPVHIRGPHAWKKHVLSDLQPYTCTCIECDEPDLLFEDREAWYNHELQHLAVYQCGDAHHPSFEAADRFVAHMTNQHAFDEYSGLNIEVVKMFLRPRSEARTLCPLCFVESDDLKRHLGRHLQRVALFALPQNHGMISNEEAASQGSNVPVAAARSSDLDDDNLGGSSAASDALPSANKAVEAYFVADYRTGERVSCHACKHEWDRAQRHLACPKCESESVKMPEPSTERNTEAPGATTGSPTPTEIGGEDALVNLIPDTNGTTWDRIKPALRPISSSETDTTEARPAEGLPSLPSDDTGPSQSRSKWHAIILASSPEPTGTIKKNLASLGWDATAVSTGTELLCLLERRLAFDLLFLDIRLPYLDDNGVPNSIETLMVNIKISSAWVKPQKPIVALNDSAEEILSDSDLFASVMKQPFTQLKLKEVVLTHCSQYILSSRSDLGSELREKMKQDWPVFYSLSREDIERKSWGEIQYQKILHKIITGEHAYVTDQLATLRELYRIRLVKLCSERKVILATCSLQAMQRLVFKPAEEVEHIQQSYLWPKLKNRMEEQGPFIDGISDCFDQWLEESKSAYLAYAEAYPEACSMIRTEHIFNSDFFKYLNDCRDHPRSRKLAWDDLLRSPITRLQQYTVLLRSLRDSLPKHRNGYKQEVERIDDLCDRVQALSRHCDALVASSDSRLPFQRYNKLIVFEEDRKIDLRLLDQERVIMISGNLRAQQSPRFGVLWGDQMHLVLFDNYLVISKETHLTTSAGATWSAFKVYIRPIRVQVLSLEFSPEVEHEHAMARSSAALDVTANAIQSPLSTTLSTGSDTGKRLYPFAIRDMSTGVTHRFGAYSAVNRDDWVMAILSLREQYCEGPFAVKALYDWRLPLKLKSTRDFHIPVQVKGSAIDVAIKEQVHKPYKDEEMQFRTNYMTAMSDAGPHLLGNDFGIYAASHSSLVSLQKRSRVKKIEFIHEWGCVFVLSNQRLRAYKVRDSEFGHQVSMLNDEPIPSDPTRLRLEYIEELSRIGTTDFVIHRNGNAPICVATRVGRTGNRILLISENISTPTVRRSLVIGHFVSRSIRVSGDGQLNWAQDSEAIGQIAFGMTRCMFRELVVGTGFEYHTPIPREDGQRARVRVADYEPLGLFPIHGPQSSLEFLAVFDICAVYVNSSGSLTREMTLDFLCEGKAAALVEGYLVIIHDDFLEIRDIQNGTLVQIIEGSAIKMLNQGGLHRQFVFSTMISKEEEMLARLELKRP
jgi:CheY-like chemotaxis protein